MVALLSRKKDLWQDTCNTLRRHNIGWHSYKVLGAVREVVPGIPGVNLPFKVVGGFLSGEMLRSFPPEHIFSVEVQEAMRTLNFVRRWYISYFPGETCCDYYLEGVILTSEMAGKSVFALKLEKHHFHGAFLQALYDEQSQFFRTFGAE